MLFITVGKIHTFQNQKQEDWLRIALQFEEKWNMPHVIAAIDGKHIRMESPKLTGS